MLLYEKEVSVMRLKKVLATASIVAILTTCTAFAAKYKVNTQGVVKNSAGTVQPVNATVTPITNPYNVYNTESYVSSGAVNRTQISTIDIVMDYSGSMANWINQAKLAMRNIIAQIPPTTRVGFRVFGHDAFGTNPLTKNSLGTVKKIVKSKSGKYKVQTVANPLGSTTGVCAATQQVTPLIAANSTQILNGMSSVGIGGATPLVYALDRAVNQDFGGLATNFPKKIVLITDGGENCGGDPCAFAEQLMQRRSDVHIDVVLVSSYSSNLNCLARRTGGNVYHVNNLSDFQTIMTQSMTTPAREVEAPQGQYYEFYKE